MMIVSAARTHDKERPPLTHVTPSDPAPPDENVGVAGSLPLGASVFILFHDPSSSKAAQWWFFAMMIVVVISG